MIVFGFKAIHVEKGTSRYGTDDSKDFSNLFLSTPWNHLETGMAIKMGIPVLLLIEPDVDDGAFNEKVNDALVDKLPMSCCLDERNAEDVRRWLRRRVMNTHQQTPITTGGETDGLRSEPPALASVK